MGQRQHKLMRKFNNLFKVEKTFDFEKWLEDSIMLSLADKVRHYISNDIDMIDESEMQKIILQEIESKRGPLPEYVIPMFKNYFDEYYQMSLIAMKLPKESLV